MRLEEDRKRAVEQRARPELVGTRPGPLAGLVALVLLLIAGVMLWNAREASLSVLAGTRRLSRVLPWVAVAWPLRWAGLAGVLALSPFVGALVAQLLPPLL